MTLSRISSNHRFGVAFVACAASLALVPVFDWPSLVHEIGHFTMSWATGGQATITSTNTTEVTNPTILVRMAGWMAQWVFTYFALWSKIPVLQGLGATMAMDYLYHVRWQDDMSETINPFLVTIMFFIIIGGLAYGRQGKERRHKLHVEQPNGKLLRRNMVDALRRGLKAKKDSRTWIDEALYSRKPTPSIKRRPSA